MKARQTARSILFAISLALPVTTGANAQGESPTQYHRGYIVAPPSVKYPSPYAGTVAAIQAADLATREPRYSVQGVLVIERKHSALTERTCLSPRPFFSERPADAPDCPALEAGTPVFLLSRYMNVALVATLDRRQAGFVAAAEVQDGEAPVIAGLNDGFFSDVKGPGFWDQAFNRVADDTLYDYERAEFFKRFRGDTADPMTGSAPHASSPLEAAKKMIKTLTVGGGDNPRQARVYAHLFENMAMRSQAPIAEVTPEALLHTIAFGEARLRELEDLHFHLERDEESSIRKARLSDTEAEMASVLARLAEAWHQVADGTVALDMPVAIERTHAAKGAGVDAGTPLFTLAKPDTTFLEWELEPDSPLVTYFAVGDHVSVFLENAAKLPGYDRLFRGQPPFFTGIARWADIGLQRFYGIVRASGTRWLGDKERLIVTVELGTPITPDGWVVEVGPVHDDGRGGGPLFYQPDGQPARIVSARRMLNDGDRVSFSIFPGIWLTPDDAHSRFAEFYDAR